jgi:hypothetical protein
VFASGLLIVLITGAGNSRATERFSIVANNEKVGHILVERHATAIDIDYAISDNGRGPKHKEHLIVSANGIPTEWSIEGTSLMGAVSPSTRAGRTDHSGGTARRMQARLKLHLRGFTSAMMPVRGLWVCMRAPY